MDACLQILLKEAREEFNSGRSGKGKKGTIFRCCINVYTLLKKTYINGTHSDCRTLSFYYRPKNRSNQGIEGSNKSKIILTKTLHKVKEFR